MLAASAPFAFTFTSIPPRSPKHASTCSPHLCCKCGVPLLPQELARADEGCGVLELPPHHVGPLVETQGEVPVCLMWCVDGCVGGRWRHRGWVACSGGQQSILRRRGRSLCVCGCGVVLVVVVVVVVRKLIVSVVCM